MSTKYDVTCSQNGLLNCYDKKYEKIPFDNSAIPIKQISASNYCNISEKFMIQFLIILLILE